LSAYRYPWIVLFLCMILPGCDKPVSQVISGKVTLKKDVPVTIGMVTFFRSSTGDILQSTLGEGGAYTLPTSVRALPPGEYKVTITPISVRNPSGDSPKNGESYVEKGGKSIPVRYRKRDKTPLRATIPSDDPYDFDMVP